MNVLVSKLYRHKNKLTKGKTPGEAIEIHLTLIKMEFIKEESEEMKIEETFSVKQEEILEVIGVKQEDTEEQTKIMLIKEESEDMKIEETSRVKHEDTEEQTKMVFIKEESEDMKIEETFNVKHEDTEEQTDLMLLKEESQELNEMEEKDRDLITGEKSVSCSWTEKSFAQKKSSKDRNP
ncbi:chemotaxis regulatory protein ChePep-like isoform X1 [Pseudorasbora parva]|uniref:chemotaxis regulatory protein ChePep-like isoform X1 n=2 Tax=Pseudorasbora parva TaxID=51549 RepID=UPI00351F76E9